MNNVLAATDSTLWGLIASVRNWLDLSTVTSESDKRVVLGDLGLTPTDVPQEDAAAKKWWPNVTDAIRKLTNEQLMGFADVEDADNVHANNDLIKAYSKVEKDAKTKIRKTFFQHLKANQQADGDGDDIIAERVLNTLVPMPPASPPMQQRVERTLYAPSVTIFSQCMKKLTTLLIPDQNPHQYTPLNVPLQVSKAQELPAVAAAPAEESQSATQRLCGHIKRIIEQTTTAEAKKDVAYKWPHANTSALAWFAVLTDVVAAEPNEKVNLLCTCSSNPDSDIKVAYITQNIDLTRLVMSRIIRPGTFLMKEYLSVGYERAAARKDCATVIEEKKDDDDALPEEEEEEEDASDFHNVLSSFLDEIKE